MLQKMLSHKKKEYQRRKRDEHPYFIFLVEICEGVAMRKLQGHKLPQHLQDMENKKSVTKRKGCSKDNNYVRTTCLSLL